MKETKARDFKLGSKSFAKVLIKPNGDMWVLDWEEEHGDCLQQLILQHRLEYTKSITRGIIEDDKLMVDQDAFHRIFPRSMIKGFKDCAIEMRLKTLVVIREFTHKTNLTIEL